MSDRPFLAYSRTGSLVGGFRTLAIRRRGGAWTEIATEANVPAWLDDETVIWQQDAYRNDGRQAFLKTTDGRTFPRRAGALAAGSGRWVAQHEAMAPGGSRAAVVLHDGTDRVLWGDPRPGSAATVWGAGQHSVGVDGTLVYTPRYLEGRGVVIEARDGRQIVRRDGLPVATTSCVDRDAVVIFSAADAGRVWVWNGSTFTQHRLAWPSYNGTAFRRPDGIYVAYSSGSQPRVVVHRVDDATTGWLLGRAEAGFNACGWTDESGQTWIAWSETAGATLASIREQPLTGDPSPWPVSSPPPPPPPDEDEPDDEDDAMTTAQFNALRDAQKRIELSLTSIHGKLDELAAPVPLPPPPDPDPDPSPPPSGEKPSFSMNDLIYLGPDVSEWAETSRMDRVGIEQGPNADQGKVCFPHTKAGQWPAWNDGPGKDGEGNVWVVGIIGGTPYAATAEWLKPGQTCKRFTAQVGPPASNNWGIGPHTKKEPLESWSPKPGEWVGWFVTTRARDSKRSVDEHGNEVLERSNLVWVRWPS